MGHWEVWEDYGSNHNSSWGGHMSVLKWRRFILNQKVNKGFRMFPLGTVKFGINQYWPVLAEIFQAGSNWWTDEQTDRLSQLYRAASMAQVST